jgi:hypothetical protein
LGYTARPYLKKIIKKNKNIAINENNSMFVEVIVFGGIFFLLQPTDAVCMCSIVCSGVLEGWAQKRQSGFEEVFQKSLPTALCLHPKSQESNVRLLLS